jgi:hypothetical protein
VLFVLFLIWTRERLKLNGTHQLLAYAGDVNIMEGNIDTVKENTDALLEGNKEVV